MAARRDFASRVPSQARARGRTRPRPRSCWRRQRGQRVEPCARRAQASRRGRAYRQASGARRAPSRSGASHAIIVVGAPRRATCPPAAPAREPAARRYRRQRATARRADHDRARAGTTARKIRQSPAIPSAAAQPASPMKRQAPSLTRASRSTAGSPACFPRASQGASARCSDSVKQALSMAVRSQST